jgi:ABC-type antimicrobial peptide transport system permease subunit
VNWLFISGNRRVVTGGLVVAVYVAMVATTLVEPGGARRLLTEQNTVQMLLNTFLSGVILLVSIVVSINSLVVSQELTPIGNQHQRVVESWNFRKEAAEFV